MRKILAAAAAAVIITTGLAGCGFPHSTRGTPSASAAAAPAAVEQVTVPDVTGMIARQARATIEAIGLETDYSADAGIVLDQDNWTVLSMTPAAGTKVDRGATIVLSVTKTANLQPAAPAASAAPAAPAAPQYTLSQANAIKQTKSYLQFTAFSRQSLIDQLAFEGYSTEDATFAVDTVAPDWNEQCAKKAADYLSFSAFSRDELYGQLEYEGFTPDQIEYGLAAVGY